MGGPFLLIGFVLASIIGWACAERYGAPWVRIVASFVAFVAFAFLGAGILAIFVVSEEFSTRIRLNQATADMLDRTIERVESDDDEALLEDLREMRTHVVPTYESWTFEEPFVEFARSKDVSSPESGEAP